MKRWISGFLIVFLLLGSSLVIEAEEELNASEQNALELLTALGVVSEATYQNEAITRGEFIFLLMTTIHEDEGEVSRLPFYDVEEDDSNAKAIMAAYDRGYISGEGRYFNPNEQITFEQALKILLCALGYNIQAEQNGGYPQGYSQIARSLGWFSRTGISGSEVLSWKNARLLLVNALETPILKQTAFGEDSEYKKDNSVLFMNEKLDLYKNKGIVTANSLTGLDGLSAGNGFVNVDGVRYFEGLSGIGNFLGQNVAFYFRQTVDEDCGTILYARSQENKHQIYEVTSEELEEGQITEQKFVFFQENTQKTKSLTLEDDVVVVYNGKALFAYNRTHMKPQNGTVTLIDNDLDGNIEVVIVRNFEILVVMASYEGSSVIYPKYGKASVDISEFKAYSMTKDGKDILPEEIKEWDIISLAKSLDNQVAEIFVSRKSVSGIIQETIIEDENISKIIVENQEYCISTDYAENLSDLNIGKSGVFLLSVDGQVVTAKFDSTQKPNYAILIGTQVCEGLAQPTKFQFFNQMGEIEILDGAEKIKVNDVNLKATEAVSTLNASGLYQLVIYDADTDGKLRSVKTALDRYNEDDYVGYDNNYFSRDKNLASCRFTDQIGGGATVTTETLSFWLPTDKTKTDYYKTESYISFRADQTLKNVYMYDMDEFSRIGVIVVDNFDQDTPADTPSVSLYGEAAYFAVSKLTSVLASDGSERLKLCGYAKNIYKEYFIQDEFAKNVDTMMYPDGGRLNNPTPNTLTKWGFTNHVITDVKPGDVMMLSLNGKNEVMYYRMLFSSNLMGCDIKKELPDGKYLVYAAPGDYYEIGEVTPTKGDPSFITMLYTAYGEVVSRSSGGHIRYKTWLTEDGGAEGRKRYNVQRVTTATTGVYAYYRSRQKLQKVTISEVQTGDKCFVFRGTSVCYTILLIRD